MQGSRESSAADSHWKPTEARMKLKTLLHLAGFRPAARSYGHRIETFDLPREGKVRYAQWLHPKETPKQITQQHVDQPATW